MSVEDDRLRAALVRYLWVQGAGTLALIVGLGLVAYWLNWPWWIVAVVVALSIAKDAWLYPRVRHAYAPSPGAAERMIGREGRAVRAFVKEGLVRIDHEVWRARVATSDATVAEGQLVRVTSVVGLMLVVEAVERGGSPGEGPA